MIKRVALIVTVVAVLIGLLVYSQHRPVPPKVSGFVEAHEVRVGSRVGGRIAAVKVVEGQQVTAGAELIVLEPFDLKERQAEAEALAAAKKADYDRLVKGYRSEDIDQAKARRDNLAARYAALKFGPRKQDVAEGQAQLDLAMAQRDLSQGTYDRVKRLFDSPSHGASQEEMDRATNELKAALARVAVAQEELSKLKEGTRQEEIDQAKAQLAEAEAAVMLETNGYRKEEIDAAKAAMLAAEQDVAMIAKQLTELTIKAPVDGIVEAVELRPGDLIGASSPALSLQDMSELWVRAYVPENRLNLHAGQTVRVTVDSYPGVDFKGHVSFVAQQAEFTPGNVQTPEERSKQVFRIKVEMDTGKEKLRPGMNADVWLQ